MIPFDEVTFPDLLRSGLTGGPEFDVTVLSRRTGDEVRIANRRYALHQYNTAPVIRNETTLQQIISFYVARRGSARGFRFRDWFDFSTNANDVVGEDGLIDASSARGLILLEDDEYRLYKRYTDGSYTYDRRITKPRNITLYVGSSVVSSATYTITSNGKINFTGTAPSGVRWVGTFDVPVRFSPDGDELQSITLTDFRNNDFAVPLEEVIIFDGEPSWHNDTPLDPTGRTNNPYGTGTGDQGGPPRGGTGGGSGGGGNSPEPPEPIIVTDMTMCDDMPGSITITLGGDWIDGGPPPNGLGGPFPQSAVKVGDAAIPVYNDADELIGYRACNYRASYWTGAEDHSNGESMQIDVQWDSANNRWSLAAGGSDGILWFNAHSAGDELFGAYVVENWDQDYYTYDENGKTISVS